MNIQMFMWSNAIPAICVIVGVVCCLYLIVSQYELFQQIVAVILGLIIIALGFVVGNSYNAKTVNNYLEQKGLVEEKQASDGNKYLFFKEGK